MKARVGRRLTETEATGSLASRRGRVMHHDGFPPAEELTASADRNFRAKRNRRGSLKWLSHVDPLRNQSGLPPLR
jgi:hypothetical protein